MAARGDEPMLVQHMPRAWIDLNRDERERDPLIDEGARMAPRASAKLRSGLAWCRAGMAGHGDIWMRRFTDAEIVQRIEADHRPYHQALARSGWRRRGRGSGWRCCSTCIRCRRWGRRGWCRASSSATGMARRPPPASSAGSRRRREAEASPSPAMHLMPEVISSSGMAIRDAAFTPSSWNSTARSISMPRWRRRGPGFDATVTLVRRILSALAAEALGQPAAMAAE